MRREYGPIGFRAFVGCASVGILVVTPVPTARAQGARTPQQAEDTMRQAPRRAVGRERTAGINYEYTHLTGGFDPWHRLTLDRTGHLGRTPVVARLHLARRFGEAGAQAEAEAYPRLGSRGYLYLNAARRIGARNFIRTRGAAEFYHDFGRGWEGSLGGRYFDHERERDLVGLSGTAGKYVGNYWNSVRPTIVFGGSRRSHFLAWTSRRYFATAHDYLGLRLGAGTAPDENRDDISLLERDGLRSHAGAIERKHTLRNDRVRVTYGVGFEREEYRRDADGRPVARRHFSVQMGSEIILR